MKTYFLMCIVGLSVLFVVCLFFFFKEKRKKKGEREKLKREVEESLRKFRAEFEHLQKRYIPRRRADACLREFKEGYELARANYSKFKRYNKKNAAIKDYVYEYENFYQLVDEANKKFVAQEKIECADLLEDIDGRVLDDQQQTAVVSDENYNLVIAGAGSGKTLTIAGKVKYLYERKDVDEEDILLITFTNKAVDEMNHRIKENLKINTTATTFHKLGLDILKNTKTAQMDIVESPKEFVNHYFQNVVINRPDVMKKLLKYFAYFVNTPANLEEFDSLGEAYEYEKTAELETIKSKYQQAQYIREAELLGKEITESLQGEEMKSLEEVEIANYLFLHGVEYEYEKAYPYTSDDVSRKTYRPDFYLPEYDIWLEHFGVTKDNKTPWLSPMEEQKYLNDMSWKRDMHAKNGTKLLETYHYYSAEGRLLGELKTLLEKNGVQFEEPDFVEIFSKIYGTETERYLSEFTQLCCTFLVLFKSNGYTLEDLKTMNYKNLGSITPFKERKLQLFKALIAPIIKEYQNYLDERNAIDFSDMINLATEAVKNGAILHPYKYVIVDEYQDVSVAQYKLIKSIVDRTGANLFCVGDDWQSIYRFAGSDIGLFTDFEEKFGFAAITSLKQTYRNSVSLITEAGTFVMQNPKQIKKELKSNKELEYPVVFMGYEGSPYGALQRTIKNIIRDYGENSSVLLLGRTQHDFKMIQESGLFELSEDKSSLTYIENPVLQVAFLTVHKAKGLEADNVVLLNFKNELLGFPNKIADDPILELVLSSKEPYRYAEERRLLYVALTRTRNRVFVLTDTSHASEFMREFKPSKNIYFSKKIQAHRDVLSCPKCKTGHLVMRVNTYDGRNFIGCSNYPKCDYTLSDVNVLIDQKRCPDCGGYLIRRTGKYGEYYQCSNSPLCKHKESRRCPTCGGKLSVRKGQYGNFVACHNYPKCLYVEDTSVKDIKDATAQKEEYPVSEQNVDLVNQDLNTGDNVQTVETSEIVEIQEDNNVAAIKAESTESVESENNQ